MFENNTETENERVIALAMHLECTTMELNEGYNDNIIEVGSQEYLVVTDDEVDDLWEEELDHYVDELILPEIPEFARNYFDDEAWKRDARMDGRAHSLARYDGHENYEEVDGTTYYIYRMN